MNLHRQTDKQTDRMIPIYPIRGYKNGHNIITSKNELETGIKQMG